MIDRILTFLRGREPSYIFSNIRVRKNFDSFGTKLSYLVSAASVPHTLFQTSMFEKTSTVLFTKLSYLVPATSMSPIEFSSPKTP